MKKFTIFLGIAGALLTLSNYDGLASLEDDEQANGAQWDLQRVLMMSEVIPYSWSYKIDGRGTIFTVDSDNPILRELKLELDLADEQMRKIKEFAELLIELHQDIGKALTHYEILQALEKEGGRRLSEEELQEMNELERRRDLLEEELLTRIKEINKSLVGKKEYFFRWIEKRESLHGEKLKHQILQGPFQVLATREGLVGYTTANGHVIVPDDWFVALPHRNPLSPNDSTNGWDSKVRVTYGDRSVIAPVWDVGPWNTKDNYWDPEVNREIYGRLAEYWQTNSSPRSPLPSLWDPDSFSVPPVTPPLGLGNPEAWQAYLTSVPYTPQSYNYGCDQFGRHRWYTPAPLNGAGMDLADGAFWNGLQLADNDTVDWDFTSDLPMVERVILTQVRSGTTVTIYDSETGEAEPAEEGNLIFEIRFNETMNTLIFPEVSFGSVSPYDDFDVTASAGWSRTTYEEDTWIGTAMITGQMQICCSGTHRIRIVARDLGNNQIDQDEDTEFYDPGPDTIHRFIIQSPDFQVFVPDPFRIVPNPFSQETEIYYKLSRPAHVVLKIYDIAGRLVLTLINEEKKAGSYTVPWEGEDDSGQRVGSGVYFFWIEARIGQVQDFIRTRKLILLR